MLNKKLKKDEKKENLILKRERGNELVSISTRMLVLLITKTITTII